MRKACTTLIALLVLATIAGGIWCYTNTGFTLSRHNDTAGNTQIESLKDIGQWEFLAISREEIVDTTAVTEHKVLGFTAATTSRHLARIYTGTVRLGIDLKEDTKDRPDWIKREADTTLHISLPRPHLLDENFIDEAATRALIEDGTWTHAEKAQLTDKARRQLKASCLTEANLKRAEEAATEQLTQLLHTLGATKVKVELGE